MPGTRLYDANKRQSQFKQILPVLDEMAERDEIESAIISIVKKTGETVMLKVGLGTVREAQTAVGALEVAKASVVADILFSAQEGGG